MSVLLAGSSCSSPACSVWACFISTVSSTQQQAMVTAFFFIMPAVAFSGFGFPIATMPQWMQYLTYLVPLRYFLLCCGPLI
jgi:ABC-2 type transport system permease protein